MTEKPCEKLNLTFDAAQEETRRELSRRDFIGGAVLSAGILLGNRGDVSQGAFGHTEAKLQYEFPKNFLWGAGTAGVQHEGSPLADGASESVLYKWAHTPGTMPSDGTFDVAADQYHRFPSDLELMRELNLNAYNFEIYWPRIFPEGTGRVNQLGLDFYDRLVDEFLKAGISPLCNLYVFDHPAALEQRGGWLNRDSANWFAEYAAILFYRLGDRVKYWATMCETHLISELGAFLPRMSDVSANLRATHHLLLGQGRAVQAFRASGAKGQIGNYQLVVPVKPASDKEPDVAAAERVNAYFNLLLLDSQLRGEYPKDLIEWYGNKWPEDAIKDGDLATISAPIDFFGMDYYFNMIIEHASARIGGDFDNSYYGGDVRVRMVPATGDGLHEALIWVRDRYRKLPIIITEIGTAVPDIPKNGKVDDVTRMEYIRDLLTGAHRATKEGVDLRGIFVWSFVDGWEFQKGLSSRYGLIYIDYKTQERIVKSSGQWYRDMIAASGFDLPKSKDDR